MPEHARHLSLGPARTVAPGRAALPPGHVAWSASRRRLLEECERAYYWRYLGARAGYKAHPNSETRRAWTLKHLTALPLLMGTVVHAAARQLLLGRRDGLPIPTPDEALAAARLALRHVWLTSARQPDRFWTMPGVYTAFLEIIYRGALTEREITGARERLAASIEALYTMPLLQDLVDAPSSEILIGEGVPSWFLTAAGEVVWVELDLAYRHRGETPVGTFASGVPVIVDFKTGSPRPEEERVPLAAYALYLRDALGWQPAEGVFLGRVVYLAHARERWLVMGADELRAFEGLVAEDTVRMERMLIDPALGTARAASSYALASDRASCGRCPFLDLCRPELGESVPFAARSVHPPDPRNDPR